ncbi:Uma2 family endonuclease [Geitlerinema sp. PCC 9228]|uniref:Uma2 family endonuclease n=1 Tax=Geitlerinema sp. PCC 9228 TaxID=111611 RepID=UPI0008F99EA1|nr:Uma2 family endonuclease [Geitlerinema sp. PCC 9228]
MTTNPSVRILSLADFLAQPDIESSPAWEFLAGKAVQKPMPTLFHSRLQRNLVNYISDRTEQFEAIQELRCIVPPYSPVPDIAIVDRDRLPAEDQPFNGAPDWLVEIGSRNQSRITLQTKILHCLSNGTQLAWFIDTTRERIWVWQGDDLPMVCSRTDPLPDLNIQPQLTVESVVAMVQQR